MQKVKKKEMVNGGSCMFYTLYAIRDAIRNTLSVIRYPLYALRYKNMQNKANLLDAQMNVSSLITKDYRNNGAFAVQKNKANSKPIKANFKTEVRRQKTDDR